MSIIRAITVALRASQTPPLSAAQNDSNLGNLRDGVNASTLTVRDGAGTPVPQANSVITDATGTGAVLTPTQYLAYSDTGVLLNQKTSAALGLPTGANGYLVETYVNRTDGVVIQKAWGRSAGSVLVPVQYVRTGTAADGWQAWQYIWSSIEGSAWNTGDVKTTLVAAAPAGWVLANDGSIGDGASGATYANIAALALFTFLWNGFSNAICPVSTGRGANAAADWAAHKTISLVPMAGRVLGATGAGAGLTARALADRAGEETHALSVGELAAHHHNVTHEAGSDTSGTGLAGSSSAQDQNKNTDDTGNGDPHNNMQPTTFLNVLIKL